MTKVKKIVLGSVAATGVAVVAIVPAVVITQKNKNHADTKTYAYVTKMNMSAKLGDLVITKYDANTGETTATVKAGEVMGVQAGVKPTATAHPDSKTAPVTTTAAKTEFITRANLAKPIEITFTMDAKYKAVKGSNNVWTIKTKADDKNADLTAEITITPNKVVENLTLSDVVVYSAVTNASIQTLFNNLVSKIAKKSSWNLADATIVINTTALSSSFQGVGTVTSIQADGTNKFKFDFTTTPADGSATQTFHISVTLPTTEASKPVDNGNTTTNPSKVTVYTFASKDYDTEAKAQAAVDVAVTPTQVWTFNGKEYATEDAAWVDALKTMKIVNKTFNDADVTGADKALTDFTGKYEAGTKTIYTFTDKSGKEKSYKNEAAAKAAWLIENPIKIAKVGDGSGKTYTQAQIDSATATPAPAHAVVGANTAAVPTGTAPTAKSAADQAAIDAAVVGDIIKVKSTALLSGTHKDDDHAVSLSTVSIAGTSYAYILITTAKHGQVYTTAAKAQAAWETANPGTPAVGDGSGKTYTQAEIDARDNAGNLPGAHAVVGANTAEVANTEADAVTSTKNVESSITFANGDEFKNSWKPAGTTIIHFLAKANGDADLKTGTTDETLLNAKFKTDNASLVVKGDSATKVNYNGKTYDNKAAAYKDLITSKQVDQKAAPAPTVSPVVQSSKAEDIYVINN